MSLPDSIFTLWCGNLSPKVDEELLFELFLQAGPVDKVTIPKDKNGISKGYGFVIFKHEVSVLYAIELMKDVKLFDKRILPQHRTTDKNPNYHRRASLPDFKVHPDVNHRTNAHNQNYPANSNAFQGFQIPVLGANVPQTHFEHPQMSPFMGPPMSYGIIPHSHMDNHQRRRTHHGGPLNHVNYFTEMNYQQFFDGIYGNYPGWNNQNYAGGMNHPNYSDRREDFQSSPPVMNSPPNIVPSVSGKNKHEQRVRERHRPKYHDQHSSKELRQEKPSFRTFYDRRRRSRK